MPIPCRAGCGKNAVLKRPKTGDTLCKECFYWAFETEIHFTIVQGKLFKTGDSVAIAASGGKDSTVLAQVLKTLNERYSYGLNLMLLSIDEGITGYRDDSLETVKQNRDDYEMNLKILSYKDLYGWTMDEIVAQIGRKNNCTFCGVFRRQALDRGAALLGVKCIATGHNADDIAETVLMNILRGDIARLQRCTAIITGSEGSIPRVKPLKYTYEKEIVMYAHYKKLVYFSTECVFAPNAYRGHARALLKDLEKIRPACIMDIIYSGETMSVKEKVTLPELGVCIRCNFVSSQKVCKACVLLEGLNKGLPRLGIGKSSKAKRMLAEHAAARDHIANKEKSKGECCGSGLCKNHAKTNLENDIEETETKTKICNGFHKDESNRTVICHCKKSAEDGISKYDVTNDLSSKASKILSEFGIPNLERNSDKVLTERGHASLVRNNLDERNNDEAVDDVEQLLHYAQDDDSCSGSCGRMENLQIGF